MNWISVKDRLPEKAGDYFVFVYWGPKDHRFDIVHYTKKNKWEDFPECITHWMPLPEPPKDINEIAELKQVAEYANRFKDLAQSEAQEQADRQSLEFAKFLIDEVDNRDNLMTYSELLAKFHENKKKG